MDRRLFLASALLAVATALPALRANHAADTRARDDTG